MLAYDDRKDFAKRFREKDQQAFQRAVSAALIYCSVREDRTWRSTELDETLHEVGLQYVASHFPPKFLDQLARVGTSADQYVTVWDIEFNRKQLPAFIKYLKEEYYGCTPTS